jgi:hypothetical protein
MHNDHAGFSHSRVLGGVIDSAATWASSGATGRGKSARFAGFCRTQASDGAGLKLPGRNGVAFTHPIREASEAAPFFVAGPTHAAHVHLIGAASATIDM